MFFSDWSTIFRILVVGTLAYILLVVVLQGFGKRTLSKMNAFDFIVTVALGSTLATILTSRDLTLVDGVVAFTLLIFLQYLITELSLRSKFFSKLIKSQPRMLFYKGEFDQEMLKKERVLETEVLQAVRSSGIGSMDDVLAVVLETDGNFSVIQHTTNEMNHSVLRNIEEKDTSGKS